MQALEEGVRATLESLRARHRHHLALKRRGDGYYVFETMAKWDKAKRRYRTLSLYIGKIELDGRFVEPVRKKSSTKGIKNLDSYVKQMERAELQEGRQSFESEYEPLILRELSTNPRDGVAAISKRIGLPYQTTLYWIRKLEKKYDIRYTIEYWFLRNFGFDRYISIAKFKGPRPNVEELRKALEGIPYVQLAVLTRGAYDLFLFLVAPNIRLAEDTIYQIRSKAVFAKCPAEWYASYYQQGMGYIPLRDAFFDVLKERVWKRTRETPRKQKDQLLMREYATLRELNTNGVVEFSKIDGKYMLKSGSAQYTYHKLIAEDMIKRATITMEKPPVKDIAVIIAAQLDVNKFNAHREEYLREIISDEDMPLNKYVFAGDIGSPYGVLLMAPLYRDGDLERIEAKLGAHLYGSELRTSLISSTLVGNLGLRKIDTTKTWVYDTLAKEYSSVKEPLAQVKE